MAVYYSSDQAGQLDVYGSMYQRANAVPTTITTVNLWYQVVNFSAGELAEVTFASDALTVARTGPFAITWACDAVSALSNKTFEFTVTVDDVVQAQLTMQHNFATANREALSSTSVITLTAGEVIKYKVRNITDNTNITIVDCNLALHRA